MFLLFARSFIVFIFNICPYSTDTAARRYTPRAKLIGIGFTKTYLNQH